MNLHKESFSTYNLSNRTEEPYKIKFCDKHKKKCYYIDVNGFQYDDEFNFLIRNISSHTVDKVSLENCLKFYNEDLEENFRM